MDHHSKRDSQEFAVSNVKGQQKNGGERKLSGVLQSRRQKNVGAKRRSHEGQGLIERDVIKSGFVFCGV